MGLSSAMLDRLAFKDTTISSMVNGLRDVEGLKDPVATMGPMWLRPNGLQIARMRIPLVVADSLEIWRFLWPFRLASHME
jgi:glutamate-5-semialdehyde dehydrogenase